jgi:DNA helicase-2/ATP-dependent DNA helicase PcrA
VAHLLALPPGIAPDGQRWPDGRKDGVRPSDIAVLCRKRVQFPLLRQELADRGIPVEVVGLGGLLTVPEIQDVVATLRVLHDPGASDALARLLTGPRWRIGPRDLSFWFGLWLRFGGRRGRSAGRGRRRRAHPGRRGSDGGRQQPDRGPGRPGRPGCLLPAGVHPAVRAGHRVVRDAGARVPPAG